MTSAIAELAPLAAAARLGGRPGRVVLASARVAEGSGRYSIVASDPISIIDSSSAPSPLEALDAALASGRQSMPMAIGFLGYDIGAELAGVERPAGPASSPDLWFGIYDAVYRYDHQLGRGEIVATDAAAAGALSGRLAEHGDMGPQPTLGSLEPAAGADDCYRIGFERIAEYLAAGDCYQVNLSRRLVAVLEEPGDPLALFATLCEVKPEPFAALIETGTHAVLSGSPERFLHQSRRGARLETRPIKGTRARLGDEVRDRAARAALVASEKERAEHLMIVDLERNDLGRIAETGSVRVDAFADIVELPTLFHMVSTVSCQPLPDLTISDVLRATFPGGSITGAPKRRAMEIISELEPAPRGVYTGAIGVLDADGGIDLSIAIRTAVLCDTALSLHVGGGIVADSQLERELAETDEKAAGWRAVLDAMSLGRPAARANVLRG